MKDACEEGVIRQPIVQISEKNEKDMEKKLMFININDIREIYYVNYRKIFTINEFGQQDIKNDYYDKPIVEVVFKNGAYINMSYDNFKKYLGKYLNFFE